MIRNVIFDWSGTLVDDLPAVWQATNVVLRQAGVQELTLDQFRAEFSLPFQQFYDRFTPHVPLAELEGWFHEAFRALQHAVVELPHARSFLEFCRQQGLRCFVLSTVRCEYFLAQTARNGFGPFFERVWLDVWDKRQQIGSVLADAGLEVAETLLIGDMQHDIETARHGGVWSCAVLTGYNTLAQLRAAKPDLIVTHLEELRQTLLRHGMRLPVAAEQAEAPAGPRLTVAGLIVNPQGQVLLVRSARGLNLWGVPGGQVRRGESGAEAVRRVLEEATNLEVGEVEFVLAQDRTGLSEFEPETDRVLLSYLCRCADHEAVNLNTVNTELVEFRWVSLDQAGTLPLTMPARTLLEAVARRGPPAWAAPAASDR